MGDFEIELKFDGLEQIISNIKTLTDKTELNEVTKQIVTEVSSVIKPLIQSKMPKSSDLSKSGRKTKGQARVIPSQHSVDAFPVSNFREKNGMGYIVLGWTNTNNNNFYIKFSEFGNTKIKPNHFFRDNYSIAIDLLRQKAIPAYSKILQEKLDGR